MENYKTPGDLLAEWDRMAQSFRDDSTLPLLNEEALQDLRDAIAANRAALYGTD